MAHTPPAPVQLLRDKQVREITGLSRTTTWRLIQAGAFPPPVHLSPRTRAWVAADVHGWLARKVAEAQRPVGA